MGYRRFLPLAAAGAAVWYVRRVHRFRDPVRLTNAAAGAVLSPADGIVSFVRRVMSGEIAAESLSKPIRAEALLGQKVADGWLIGIFVGPLEVHYTYQPASGQVVRLNHLGSRTNVSLTDAVSAAKFLAGQPSDLLSTRGTLENERLTVTTQGDLGDITVALVAPGAGLKATSYLREHDQARAGNKTAFLPEGGLVLLHVPTALVPQVGVGDRVQGGQTVAAQITA